MELTFERCEKKLVVPAGTLDAIIRGVQSHMEYDGFCEGGKWYPVQSIYFDDRHDTVIGRSLERPFYKEKLRLRYYSDTPGESSPLFLELKRKISGVVYKRRLNLDHAEADVFLSGGALPQYDDYMHRQVAAEIACYLCAHDVSPRVHISCRRLAFFGREDRSLRVTFDRALAARRRGLNFDLPLSESALLFPDDPVIMEIKFGCAVPLWLTRLLGENGARFTSFSKYGREYGQYMKQINGGKQNAAID